MNINEVARLWQLSGVSTIPIATNQTKRPVVEWAAYQVQIPSLHQVDEWWGNGKLYGLAVICGKVSGNLEMTEIEGRAAEAGAVAEIRNQMGTLGAGPVWDYLTGESGYSEVSPSGGLHLIYRISDHDVPGNTKIARGPDRVVLAETRGEGGYVIVAPTPGICHPSGESWDLIDGEYGKVPTITWEQRCLLHEAIKLVLDPAPTPDQAAPVALPGPVFPPGLIGPSNWLSATGASPGDDFEARTDWAEILEPHGWLLESQHGQERHWTRPGKDRRQGSSATTGRAQDRDRLYVFSSSTLFEPEVPYTKFGAFALLNFAGDHKAAAVALKRRGFGASSDIVKPLDGFGPEIGSDETFTWDDTGNTERLWDRLRGMVHYVKELKTYYRWTGTVWAEDFTGHIAREWVTVTEEMASSADGDLAKYSSKCRSKKATDAVRTMLRDQPGCTVKWSQFDRDRGCINVRNGILDLKTRHLQPHQPEAMMTDMFGASYVPGQDCPRFTEFMAQAVPDEEMLVYLQRALGYSLLGDVDQRAIFWIYGPPGTGKSTLTETIRCVFGDYGVTAPSGTFRQRSRNDGPTNDLHTLRGKRFVTGSETAESAAFDEDLLKRLSGRDEIVSRALYQENIHWTARCVLWMATNNPPRFTTDDDAIWRRTKLIPFMTVFEGSGSQVTDYARSVLVPEADGILNWLLEGLQGYLAEGLGEPEAVGSAAYEQRVQSDSVARFLEERINDGLLVLAEGERIRVNDLAAMYLDWSKQHGERAVLNRRFGNRLQSHYPEISQVKINGYAFWEGLGRRQQVSIMGSLNYQRNWA